MIHSKRTLIDLLSLAGININGNNPYDIQVHNENFYKRALKDSALGLGESYMDGWWDCQALDQFFNKILLAKLENKIKINWKLKWHILKANIFNMQKISRAFQVGKRHYDIGNDLYRRMLDKRMLYTCGYWKDAKNLNEAQEDKLELVCQKINLKPGMTVLELGCGWGGLCQICSRKIRCKNLRLHSFRAAVETWQGNM
jgi:cyclopropane-fatty-acyl-phospholipid synthase